MRAIRSGMVALRRYPFMRRLVIPAVFVVWLTGLAVAGAYLLRRELPEANPARTAPAESPKATSSLVTETFNNLPVSTAVPRGWQIVAGSVRFA
jgi:hypothetical protein